jgi:membrane protease YdiL (CAAX protease family)
MESEIQTKRQTYKLWYWFGRPLVLIVIGLIILNVITFILRSLTQIILSALAIEQSTIKSFVIFIVRSLTVYYGYFFFVRISEKRKADEIAIDQRSLYHFLSGSALGVLAIGFIVAVLWLLGFYLIVTVNNSPTVFENIMFHAFFAFLQDMVFIALLFRILEQSLGSWISMGVTTLIFGFQHLLYPGQTLWSAAAQTVEVGILFCALFILNRRIWFIFGFHFAWNFIQYAIIGFPVMEHSQPLLVSQFSGPNILTGYPIGFEASLLTFFIGTGLGVFYLKKVIVIKHIIEPAWKGFHINR